MTKTISSEEGVNPRPRTSPGLSESEQNEEKFNLTGEATIDLTTSLVKSKLQVVHAMPGRIRLRTTDSRFNLLLETLSQQLKQQDGISEVYAKQETGSLLVKYDRNKVSLPKVFEILNQFGLLLPVSLQESEEKTDVFAAWRSVDFWQEQGRSLVPLVTGLLVTGKLGLHGLAAIPVYLVTASVTRQVLEYLESESTTEKDQFSQTTQRLQKSPTATATSKSAKIVYSIVHAIPGRVRFHVPLLSQDRLYAQRLEVLLKTDDRFQGYRINHATANLIITYEPGSIPDAQMRSYGIELLQVAAGASSQTGPNKANGQATQATLESVDPWAELKHPALSASLAYLADLPV